MQKKKRLHQVVDSSLDYSNSDIDDEEDYSPARIPSRTLIPPAPSRLSGGHHNDPLRTAIAAAIILVVVVVAGIFIANWHLVAAYGIYVLLAVLAVCMGVVVLWAHGKHQRVAAETRMINARAKQMEDTYQFDPNGNLYIRKKQGEEKGGYVQGTSSAFSEVRTYSPRNHSVREELPPQLEAPTQASISNSSYRLNFADNWQPDPDELFSGRGSIFGIPGSGKSNTIATVVEEIGPLHAPLLLLDTEDEYQSLCNRRYMPNGEMVNSSHVGPENAMDYGYCLMNERLQLILNLASYDRDDEAALTIVGLLQGMRQWEEERPNSERVTSMTVLDEAAIWLPQSARASLLSDDVYDQLCNAFFNTLVKQGRKRGMGIVLATQRVAEINKKALQSDWRVLHRQTELTDLRCYKDMGVKAEEAIALQNGEAFVFTGRASRLRVQLRKRYTRHESETPGLASLQRYSGILPGITPGMLPERGMSRNASVQPVEPDSIIPEIPKTQVPHEIRDQITRLWKNGIRVRTQIRDKLHLNNDHEYSWVKIVCDELEGK